MKAFLIKTWFENQFVGIGCKGLSLKYFERGRSGRYSNILTGAISELLFIN